MRFFTNEDDKDRDEFVDSMRTGEAVNFLDNVLLVVVVVVVVEAATASARLGLVTRKLGRFLWLNRLPRPLVVLDSAPRSKSVVVAVVTTVKAEACCEVALVVVGAVLDDGEKAVMFLCRFDLSCDRNG